MTVKTSLACLLLVSLGACSFTPQKDGAPDVIVTPPPGDPIPRAEPRSRYGNPDSYEQFGRRYYILDSADGYVERGIASWYGTKFHGRRTSSGEAYDMHALSAAHKTLPIPCWVEVHNLKNGKKLILRVNDRGPFVENRIIDLSFAAATRLGIVRDGTGLVEVRAISFDAQGNALMRAPGATPNKLVLTPHAEPQETQVAATTRGAGQASEPAPTDTATSSQPDSLTAGKLADSQAGATDQKSTDAPNAPIDELPATDAASGGTNNTTLLFAQVGAFSSIDNAERLFIKLRNLGFDNARILENLDLEPRLYRIQVGPVTNQADYDQLLEQLAANGIENPTRIIN